MKKGTKGTMNVEDFIKKNWCGENRWRRSELNEIAKSVNIVLDDTNSNEKLFNRIKQRLCTVKTELRDFQVESVNKMLQFENEYDGGFLLSDAGVGKSLTSISVILKTYTPTLIICPSGLIDNWINEFKKHTDLSKYEIVKYHGPGRKNVDLSHLVYITSYSIVGGELGENVSDSSLFAKMKFGRIILDEGHYIRNTNTSYSRGVLALSEMQNVDCKKWVVTATPIFNSYKDCYAYFKFLQLEGIDTRQDFTRVIVQNVYGIKVLNEWLKKYSVKYTKDQVLVDLKAKEHLQLSFKFNDLEQEFYDSLFSYSQNRLKTLVNKIKRKSTNCDMKRLLHSNVMVFILRLKQACNSPWLILNQMKRLSGSSNMTDAIERLKFFNDSKNLEAECPICYDAMCDMIYDPCGHKVCSGCWDKMQNMDILNCGLCRQFVNQAIEIESVGVPFESNGEDVEIPIEELCSSKITKLIELVNEKLEMNEKVVIVSQWVSYLDIIRESFNNDTNLKTVKSVSLQGDVQLNERTKLIQDFQTNIDTKICFVSLNSSAEGITLTAANNMVLMDKWWNYAKMDQIFNRIHRISQEKDVKIYELSIEDTIETKIQQRVVQKKKISELCLNQWNIPDVDSYDSDWLTERVVMIERLPEPNE